MILGIFNLFSWDHEKKKPRNFKFKTYMQRKFGFLPWTHQSALRNSGRGDGDMNSVALIFLALGLEIELK